MDIQQKEQEFEAWLKVRHNSFGNLINGLKRAWNKYGIKQLPTPFDCDSEVSFWSVRQKTISLLKDSDEILGVEWYRFFLAQFCTDEEEHIKFKRLLEWFVNYVQRFSQNDPGVKGGKGDRQSIVSLTPMRDRYSEWRLYKNFTLDCTALPNPDQRKDTRANYINLTDTGYNIDPIFTKSEILHLKICHKIKGIEKKGYLQKSIEDLGLFDGSEPNAELIAFFEEFKKNIPTYIGNNNASLTASEDNKGARLNMNNSIEYPKNIILYGPPGTGKTYETVFHALAIIRGNTTAEDIAKEAEIKGFKAVMDEYNSYKYSPLNNSGHIAFTTFHQSYSYEEFIEGIRPNLSGTGGISYEKHSGIFKSFCEAADKNAFSVSGGFDNFDESFDNLIDSFDATAPTIKMQTLTGKPMEIAPYPDGNGVKHVGVEAGYLSKEQLYRVYRGETGVRKRGHDNYRKAVINYMKENCGLQDYVKATVDRTSEAKRYVFIIDEINRGNISKIFGELITLIEDTKRKGRDEAREAILPYSEQTFSIPDNVYILGTMNTADRSLVQLDTALRRRFHFIEMQPKKELLKDVFVDTINLEDMLDIINKRISVLLDRDHTIGHSFFMAMKNVADKRTMENLSKIMLNKVLPLLQEYFYDDYRKIRLVLGDDHKAKDNGTEFVKKVNADKSLFGNNELDIDLDQSFQYEVEKEAFMKPEAYRYLQYKKTNAIVGEISDS